MLRPVREVQTLVTWH